MNRHQHNMMIVWRVVEPSTKKTLDVFLTRQQARDFARDESPLAPFRVERCEAVPRERPGKRS